MASLSPSSSSVPSAAGGALVNISQDDTEVDAPVVSNETIASSSKQEEDDNQDGAFHVLNDWSEDRSLVVDLHSHLNDTELADVTLCGTDEKSVVAIRSILAMRSSFFKSLFFGSFRESTSQHVQLGYSSLVLKAVVEYCYTDEIKTAFENLTFEETARSMVGLVAAGNYFQLRGLQSRAYRLTCLMMDEYPALACAVLDEVSLTEETSDLGRVALGIIRLRTESALLPPDTYGLGVQSLGAAAMEKVLADTEIQTQELALFHCLKKWAEYKPPNSSNSEERRAAARRMASKVDFSKIEPSALSTVVQESNLVPMELLLTAYRTQALQAERKGYAFAKMRSTLKEATSGSIMVQGAGLTAVNGTYTSCNALHSPLKYSRKGTLPGFGEGTFVLQTWVLQDDSKKWFLSFVQSTTTLDLYSSPVQSETDPPPMQKWLSVTVGHERLRALQNKFPSARKKHTTFESSLHGDDDAGVGDPPPICIWLPNDSSSS